MRKLSKTHYLVDFSKKIRSVLVIILFIPFAVFSQTNVTHQNLFWMRAMVQSNLNKKLFLINEIDNRRFYEGNTQHHTIQHNHLHFRINPSVDIAIGQTFSWQNPQFPDATVKLTVPEIRPFQELNAVQKINKKIVFSTRVRVDERFIRKNDGSQLLEGYNFNIRYRLRLQYQFFLWKKQNANLKISNELMVNSGKNVNFFDQNRIYIAYEHSFTNKFSAELGYLRWYQQRAQFDTYFQRDIVRLTLFKKINFTKN
ncbi:DUF2490 domain-containing protein [Lacihabitans sp. CS3-21]|nr:DUF2490 domain-containing protein [Lacihabitans sp. CS3-21]